MTRIRAILLTFALIAAAVPADSQLHVSYDQVRLYPETEAGDGTMVAVIAKSGYDADQVIVKTAFLQSISGITPPRILRVGTSVIPYLPGGAVAATDLACANSDVQWVELQFVKTSAMVRIPLNAADVQP